MTDQLTWPDRLPLSGVSDSLGAHSDIEFPLTDHVVLKATDLELAEKAILSLFDDSQPYGIFFPTRARINPRPPIPDEVSAECKVLFVTLRLHLQSCVRFITVR